INRLEDEAFLYENTASGRNRFIKVQLRGPRGNADGMGAKVTLYDKEGIQYFENKTVRGYLSSNDPIVHFGLGNVERIDSIRVDWNDGMITTLRDVETNQTTTAEYAKALQADDLDSDRPMNKDPLFMESEEDYIVHRENEVNEYKDQVLLPHTFSRSGPFIATGDVNGDGLDDFYIGGASGQPGSLVIQQDGKLVNKSIASFESDNSFEDMGAALFDADGDGDLDLYVVSGGSEFPDGSDRYNDRFYRNDGKGNYGKGDRVSTTSSGSCVVPFDADGDGDLDLFRGGQVVAHVYPKDPASYLLINEGGKFVDHTANKAPLLSRAGMVNSAVAADLDGDGKAELIVAGEWMPIRIFSARNGRYEDVSSEYGMQNTEGWWNRIIADDIDMDGDLDLIAGNLGENYKFKATEDKPFQVFAKDFDGNGTNDVFLARYYQDNRLVPIRGKECSSQQMPVISQKFPTYVSFARSDLGDILGKDMESALHYRAHLFSTVMLINDRGKLVIRKLPVEAQLSTVNGIIVRDFDGDNVKDILIAGNKFDVEVETTAADASPGLLMKGLGNLAFKPLKPFESGFFVPYNVKDLQAIDFGDHTAILVGINNEAMRIFRTRSSNGKKEIASR
ncbi:MAG: FG-GAP-like repeat-containing protein, partial [Bacteroidota bacterium]|nr:FG-GAP-like repeat-containing protein [Bacteroidota bacterium]